MIFSNLLARIVSVHKAPAGRASEGETTMSHQFEREEDAIAAAVSAGKVAAAQIDNEDPDFSDLTATESAPRHHTPPTATRQRGPMRETTMTYATKQAAEWSWFRAAHQRITEALQACLRTSSEQSLARADAFEQALMEMHDAFTHSHVRSDEGDICALCGLDLRNEIHRRS